MEILGSQRSFRHKVVSTIAYTVYQAGFARERRRRFPSITPTIREFFFPTTTEKTRVREILLLGISNDRRAQNYRGDVARNGLYSLALRLVSWLHALKLTARFRSPRVTRKSRCSMKLDSRHLLYRVILFFFSGIRIVYSRRINRRLILTLCTRGATLGLIFQFHQVPFEST